ncbi:hypothetical protein AC578_7404 [Pseudocercospora eumusae]|uniref:Uncharacterized protein n=1 Tax=Pseudocercospora eumusae TaxID=321146 RepID=A0A139H342_9PEZI|nr:hypothetical protein AC578_7404 [Pseudocercospora eumusae]
MCYAVLLTWKRCGHWRIIHEYCSDAAARTPPTFCGNAHAPAAHDIDEDDGVCPDPSRHSLSELRVTTWDSKLGGNLRTNGRSRANDVLQNGQR